MSEHKAVDQSENYGKGYAWAWFIGLIGLAGLLYTCASAGN